MVHHFLDGSGAWGWQSLAPLQGEVVRVGINLFSSIALRHAAFYARNAMLLARAVLQKPFIYYFGQVLPKYEVLK